MLGKHFASHESVDHSRNEYVRGDVFTNTVEGSFLIFKRGMKGVYQHCGEQHLLRYLAEFDFRYSNRAKLGINDAARADIAIKGITGKRLTYRRPDLYPLRRQQGQSLAISGGGRSRTENGFQKKGGGAMNTAASWLQLRFGPPRSRRPSTGLAASLFSPCRVRERDGG